MEVLLDLRFSRPNAADGRKRLTPHELALMKKHLSSLIHSPVWLELPKLHDAARRGSLSEVKYLVTECNLDVNSYWEWDKLYTALHFACGGGYADIVEFLLAQPGIEVNAMPVAWDRPIDWAIESGNVDVVRMLINHPDIHLSTVYSSLMDCPLYRATKRLNADILRLLLETYSLKFQDTGLLTQEMLAEVFSVACSYGYVDTANALIDYGHFDVNREYKSNMSPIIDACCKGQLNIVRMLFSHCQVNPYALDVPDRDWDSKYPSALEMLLRASMEGHFSVVKHLVIQPDVQHVIAESHPSLLSLCTCYAVLIGYVATTELLLDILTEALSMKCNQGEVNMLMNAIMVTALKGTTKSIPKLTEKAWDKVAIVTVSRLRDCYIEAFDGFPEAKPDSLFSIDAHILYHAVRLGLRSHTAKIVKTLPQPQCVIHEAFPGKAVSIFQMSTKSKIMENVIRATLKKYDSFVEEDTIKKYRHWYESLTIYSSDLRDMPPCDLTVEEQIEMMKLLQKSIARQKYCEDKVVCEGIHWLLNRLSELIAHETPILEFEPILVGSAAEGTRPFFPNEFDYLLVFKSLTSYFYLIPEVMNMTFRMKAKDKLSENHILSDITDNGILVAEALKVKLRDVFNKKLRQVSMEAAEKGIILEPFCNEANFHKKIHCLHVVWRGDIYKDMEITIDLVPAFEYPHYKPFNQTPLLRFNDCSFYIFTKSFQMPQRPELMPVAYSIIEVRIIQSLPENLRQGYILAKAFRRTALLKNDLANNLKDDVFNIESYLPTYMLKTCVFFIALSYDYFEDKQGHFPVRSPLEWGLRIYQKLLSFLQEGYLPVFFESLFEKHVYMASAPLSSTFLVNCRGHPYDLPDNKKPSCCIRRKNLVLITEHMIFLFRAILFHTTVKAVKKMLFKI